MQSSEVSPQDVETTSTVHAPRPPSSPMPQSTMKRRNSKLRANSRPSTTSILSPVLDCPPEVIAEYTQDMNQSQSNSPLSTSVKTETEVKPLGLTETNDSVVKEYSSTDDKEVSMTGVDRQISLTMQSLGEVRPFVVDRWGRVVFSDTKHELDTQTDASHVEASITESFNEPTTITTASREANPSISEAHNSSLNTNQSPGSQATAPGDSKRRGSRSNSISRLSASISHLSRKRDQTALLRQQQQARETELRREKKWLEMHRNWSDVKPKLLKERVRKGIPESLRGEFWRRFLDFTPLKEQNEGLFDELRQKPSLDDELIAVDVIRTFPMHVMFLCTNTDENTGNNRARNALSDVARAYSHYDPEVRYCQGISFVAATLLLYFLPEDAFWALVVLLNNPKFNFRQLYKPGFSMLKMLSYQLEHLLKRLDPKLESHLKKIEFSFMLVSPQWFMGLFVYSFPLPLALRIWDIMLYEGIKIMIRIPLYIFKYYRKELLIGDYMAVSAVLCHKCPSDVELLGDIDNFIHNALEVDITTNELANLALQWQQHYEEEKRLESIEREKLKKKRQQREQEQQRIANENGTSSVAEDQRLERAFGNKKAQPEVQSPEQDEEAETKTQLE